MLTKYNHNWRRKKKEEKSTLYANQIAAANISVFTVFVGNQCELMKLSSAADMEVFVD
jgi:hypothetical protein